MMFSYINRTCLALIVLAVALMSACKKQQAAIPISADGARAADSLLFMHARLNEIRTNGFYAEARQVPDPIGFSLKEFERNLKSKYGFNVDDASALTFCVPDASGDDEDDRFILIAEFGHDVPQADILHGFRENGAAPEGFFRLTGGLLLHFPNSKTMVVMHESLADKYQNGYAKDAKAWPFDEQLVRTAESHTLVAVLNPSKLRERESKDADRKSILEAKSITLSADLHDRDLALDVVAPFADQAAAERAKDVLRPPCRFGDFR